ncbi:probable serine/threonine-protein kinase At1g01540 [Phoenix dactylifera]|uniref:non-specific serine/threonine protein kinase n=1 Tax=Phoenix dactylifera TaxID=42345 RepID=A0A8B7CSI3_PHODC|nr:probable serine/threonine-protein kinase At1g01540 [Phoenix dactylifera]
MPFLAPSPPPPLLNCPHFLLHSSATSIPPSVLAYSPSPSPVSISLSKTPFFVISLPRILSHSCYFNSLNERENNLRMSFWNGDFLNSELAKPTSIFGLKLWVVIGICVGAAIVLVLFLLSLCLTARRCRPAAPTGKPLKLHLQDPTPPVSKDIPEIVHHHQQRHRAPSSAAALADVQIDIGGKAEHRVVLAEQHRPPAPAPPSSSTTGTASGESRGTTEGTTPSMVGGGPPEVSHLGWGHWYTLRELESATGGFAEENVIGEGGYGIVYRGLLADNSMVAVKNLLNNRGQAEKEFRVEVDTIGRIRHKNLVRLLGYCVEGAYRMLVYEYVDNGNLDQWLHGDVGVVSPLTWDIRMKIILGTAKGLAYLHEGLEPKVVHRDVKSSNILLDQQWNPKVSDFGLAKLLYSERSYVTTRVMGTFGYVAPEYASTGMLNERSDVYGFGVLVMEIISGRAPVDYTRPSGEVNLVEWLKTMVGGRKTEQVVDPKMPEKPSPKALKRALLVALRCVDPDAQKRPKMGHVIHMLEMDELLFHDDRKLGREASSQPSDRYNQREEGSFRRHDQTSWR